MDKKTSMCILQFEYDDHGHNVFLQVHKTFEHYYTEETMRCVQLDWMDSEHNAVTLFTVLNEKEFDECYGHRIYEGPNADDKASRDD